jgi:hypothetical protein
LFGFAKFASSSEKTYRTSILSAAFVNKQEALCVLQIAFKKMLKKRLDVSQVHGRQTALLVTHYQQLLERNQIIKNDLCS